MWKKISNISQFKSILPAPNKFDSSVISSVHMDFGSFEYLINPQLNSIANIQIGLDN